MKIFKFTDNRVWRAYQGGKIIDKMRGTAPALDGAFPEDWVASVVHPDNPECDNPHEGISCALIDNKAIYLDQLCETHAEELFGANHIAHYGNSPGFLMKLLDSAIRLPIQAHPDNITSMKLYNSRFGKTEAWIIVSTREIDNIKPYLIYGFNDQLAVQTFKQEALNGVMPKSLTMLHYHQVKPGDVLLIRGGDVHAIGPGITLIEIMEPTDFVVQPEAYCGDQLVPEAMRFGDIDPEQALTIFNFTSIDKAAAWSRAVLKPTIIEKNADYCLEQLIDREVIKFFGAEKLTLNGQWSYGSDDLFRAGVVIAGELNVTDSGEVLTLKQGESFFLPYSTKQCTFTGNAQLIFALPPLVTDSV